MKIFIYGLVDPRQPEVIRYVGQTRNISNRLNGHTHQRGNGPKAKWMQQLRRDGVKPVAVLLEETDLAGANDAETKWILKYYGSPQSLNSAPCASTVIIRVPKPFPAIVNPPSGNGKLLTLAKVEERYILAVLRRCRWNKLAAAKILGIGRQTLYLKLAEYRRTIEECH